MSTARTQSTPNETAEEREKRLAAHFAMVEENERKLLAARERVKGRSEDRRYPRS